jgi:NDP-sugar pyrophosphorylase family protein
VVLAAGRGERLRPLTDTTPKALLPIRGVPLVDLAIERVRPHVDAIAVNAHYLHEQLEAYLRDRDVHVSVEQPEALGTAGAIGHLRGWIDGRDVLVTNADAFYRGPPPELPGRGLELLTVEDPARGDFGPHRYAGMSYLPWAYARRLEPVPSGLYEVCWRDAFNANTLTLVPYRGDFIDCGTPADYEAANERAGGVDGGRAGNGG